MPTPSTWLCQHLTNWEVTKKWWNPTPYSLRWENMCCKKQACSEETTQHDAGKPVVSRGRIWHQFLGFAQEMSRFPRAIWTRDHLLYECKCHIDQKRLETQYNSMIQRVLWFVRKSLTLSTSSIWNVRTDICSNNQWRQCFDKCVECNVNAQSKIVH